MNPTTDPTGAPAPAGGFQNNGWYGGYNYWQGQFSPTAGSFAAGNPNGKGDVSQEVAAQTNPNNVAYINNQRAQTGAAPLPSASNPDANAKGLPTPSSVLSPSSMGTQPGVPNLGATYDQYYTNNPDVQKAQQTLKDMKVAYDKEVSTINDNPFFTEATRTGKLAKLDQQYQLDTGEPNGIIGNAQAEAQRRTNLAQGQYTMENQAWQQNLQEFNTLMSSGALENASPSTLAGLSVSTGIPTDMLQSIATSQQAKNTQLITTTDNSGNVTIAAVNSQTGKIVNTTTLAGAGGAKVGKGSGKVDENGLTKADYVSYLYNDIANGITLKSLVQHYQPYIPIDTIYTAYAANSSHGAPKETLSQVKAGQYADDKGFVSKTVN